MNMTNEEVIDDIRQEMGEHWEEEWVRVVTKMLDRIECNPTTLAKREK